MAAIEHLTISLPAKMAAKLRNRVETGEFPDIDTAVLEALVEFDMREPDLDNHAEAEWVRSHVIPALERYDADRSRGMSVDQVSERLANKSWAKEESDC